MRSSLQFWLAALTRHDAYASELCRSRLFLKAAQKGLALSNQSFLLALPGAVFNLQLQEAPANRFVPPMAVRKGIVSVAGQEVKVMLGSATETFRGWGLKKNQDQKN